jgi:hypothetical protein
MNGVGRAGFSSANIVRASSTVEERRFSAA